MAEHWIGPWVSLGDGVLMRDEVHRFDSADLADFALLERHRDDLLVAREVDWEDEQDFLWDGEAIREEDDE